MRKLQLTTLKLTLFLLLFSTLANAAHHAEHAVAEAHAECNICIAQESSDDITSISTFEICILYPKRYLPKRIEDHTNFYANFKKARSPPLS
jgi:hypothetical protein